ncbi:hypothetical protein ACRJ4W_03440 [Streptomyces sp. GLT-R25]
MQGDVVDEVVRLRQDRRLPRGEGRHGLAGGAAGDQFDGGVDLPHRAGGLGGDPSVLLGGLVAGLPGAVHLVAEAPHLDAERVLVAVRDPLLGQGGPGRVVGVLLELQGLRHSPGPEVDRHHRLGLRADLLQEADVLGEPEAVGLRRPPGEVEPPGPLLGRADRVLPLVAGDEVAAGVADGGDAEFTDELQHIGPQPRLVGRGVARLEDAGVDATAEVFHERAEETGVDFADGEGGVEGEAGGVVHGCLVRLSGWVVVVRRRVRVRCGWLRSSPRP